jgi:hypothetical protein
MIAYANDHGGKYPDGKTSTEVFQKLIDGQYINDPSFFYLRSMAGKRAATTNKLTADNVCFDVTSGVTNDAPDGLPVIFSSGYTVTYSPGANATRDAAGSPTPFPGVAVGLISKDKDSDGELVACRFTLAAEDGSIPAFVPATFKAGTNTYRQLKP